SATLHCLRVLDCRRFLGRRDCRILHRYPPRPRPQSRHSGGPSGLADRRTTIRTSTAVIITRSPLRISLGGGGTDLPSYYRKFGGFLIAAAIDKYVYITLHST